MYKIVKIKWKHFEDSIWQYNLVGSLLFDCMGDLCYLTCAEERRGDVCFSCVSSFTVNVLNSENKVKTFLRFYMVIKSWKYGGSLFSDFVAEKRRRDVFFSCVSHFTVHKNSWWVHYIIVYIWGFMSLFFFWRYTEYINLSSKLFVCIFINFLIGFEFFY